MIRFHLNALKILAIAGAWILLFSPGLSGQTTPPASNTVSLTPQTQSLLLYLKAVPEKGTLFGHHESTVYGVGWKAGKAASGEPSRSDVKSVCGDYPAVIGWDIGRIEHGRDNNINGVPFEILRREIIAHYLRGGVNMICWHVDNPLTGGDSWDVKDKKVVESILPGGAQHQKFLDWLDKAADFMNSLRAPDSTKVPIIFRPWHEHTGSWFWWGQDLCTTEQFKALWLLTCDRLRKKGCDHLLYAYSPSNDIARATELYMERYPGDDYVDILGYDCYQYTKGNNREGYMERMNKMLTYLTSLGEKHKKTIACTETGFEAVPSEDWWTGVLLPCTQNHPAAFVVMWRNAHTRHYYAPYPESLSAKDFVLYYENPKTLFCNDLKEVYEVKGNDSLNQK
jgi:mannan endo-1,4-beta-mannosidase